MNKSSKMILVLVSLIGFSLAACTRATDTASLSFSMPPATLKNKTASTVNGQALLTTDKLSRVMLNISGAGIPNQILYIWEGNRNGTFITPPATFNMVVPSGTGRLFQLLAVYSNDTTKAMKFFYGDIVRDILDANVAIDLPITEILTDPTVPLVGGQIAGRYINSGTPGNEVGPSGVVEISYAPPGRAKMLVDRGSIINGWFNFFSLSGGKLEYNVKTTAGDQLLWNGPVSLTDTQFLASSTANPSEIVNIKMPSHVRNNSGGSWSPTNDEAQILVWGYWGAGVNNSNTKQVCRPNLGTPGTIFTKLFKFGATNPYSFDLTLSISVSPTNAELLNNGGSYSAANPYPFVHAAGGSFSCSGDMTNSMSISFAQINGEGKESAAGISGVAQVQPLSGDPTRVAFITVNNNTNSLVDAKQISFKILPDLAGTIVDGFTFFRKTGIDESGFVPNCVNVANSAGLYFQSGVKTGVISSDTTIAMSTDITTAIGLAGATGVLCPMKNGQILPYGATVVNAWNFGYNYQLASGLRVDGNTTVPANTCVRQQIGFSNGFSPASSNHPVTLTALSSDGTTAISAMYQDSSCSTTANSTYSPAPGFNSSNVYVKLPAAGFMYLKLHDTDSTTPFSPDITKSISFY